MSIRRKHKFEYWALILLGCLIRPLPHGLALACGWLFARFAFAVTRFRRREALRRIAVVFGRDMSRRQALRVAWISWRNTVFNAVEMLQSGRASLDQMRRRIDGLDRATEIMLALVREHNGLVIAIPHMGNWDQAGIACTLAGVPIFSVAARQRNPLTNRLINQMRRGPAGMTVLERGSGTIRGVLRRLREGQALAILPDVRMRTPDLQLNFLGQECNLGRGMAQFARAAGVPVLPVFLTRRGWRGQGMRLADPIYPNPALDKSADHVRITAEVISLVDRAVRETPEQWFWYNRRWIGDPV